MNTELPIWIPFGPVIELELSHVPERRGVVQAGEDIFYAGSCVAVLQPAQLDRPPQVIVQSKPPRLLRFLR